MPIKQSQISKSSRLKYQYEKPDVQTMKDFHVTKPLRNAADATVLGYLQQQRTKHWDLLHSASDNDRTLR